MKNIIRGKLKQFDVALKNDSGTLAGLTELLANNGINIKAISTEVRNSGAGIAKLIIEDEDTMRNVLEKGKFSFIENEVLHVSLLDRPGELAKISKMLAKSKVNIDSIFLLDKENGEFNVAMKVSNLGAAKKVLS